MKRTVAFVAGALALSVAAYTGSRLMAQTGSARPAGAPQTRVALINLRYVFKYYKKYDAFMKGMQDQEKKVMEGLRGKLKLAEEKLAKIQTAPPDQREKLDQEARDLKRQVEDENGKWMRESKRRVIEETVKIYREIREVATAYAQSTGFEMVLQFEGGISKEEAESPGLIARNLSAAYYPMYWANGLDISFQVLTKLNNAYKGNETPVPGTGGAAGSGSSHH